MNKEELIEAFADRMVDQMDIDTLAVIVHDYLVEEYQKLTDEQLRAEVKEWAEDLLEESND